MTTSPLFLQVPELRRHRGWLLALGIILMVLGVLAIADTMIATLAAVLVLGWLMVISGVVEAVHAFRVHGWGGMFLHLIGGVLGVLIGLLVVTNPLIGALGFTLLFAALFTVVGLFRTVAAIELKFPRWGWAVFDGLVTLALGILIWAQWPSTAVWFLGLALGVSLILRGWTYVMFSAAMRVLPSAVDVRRAA